MSERIGNWMQTATGRPFWILDPRPEEIHIEDIAHALSLVCRFGGHCKFHYSVAQHSVIVAELVYRLSHDLEQTERCQLALRALMHDAAEAYVGDIIWPLKQMPEVKALWRKLEHEIESAIGQRFGIVISPMAPIIKHADLVALATEKRDVMDDGPGKEDGADREAAASKERLGGWHCDHVEPLPRTIRQYTPSMAKTRFLECFEDFGGKR